MITPVRKINSSPQYRLVRLSSNGTLFGFGLRSLELNQRGLNRIAARALSKNTVGTPMA